MNDVMYQQMAADTVPPENFKSEKDELSYAC
jgi:hypothetical protein